MALITDLVVDAPGSCDSNMACAFLIAANGTTPVIIPAGSGTLTLENVSTGVQVIVTIPIPVDTNIAPGAGGTHLEVDIEFNARPSLFPPLPICGGGFQIAARALLSDNANPPNIHQNCPGIFAPSCTMVEVIVQPCSCTEIMDVFTTIDSFACVTTDGTIGIQGKLFECTCGSGGGCSGIPSPFVNQLNAVQIGLEDPATGIFYDFIPGAPTDNTGTFSIAFTPKQRGDFLALIPADGSKQFNLQAFFAGTITHMPSNIFSKSLNISGPLAGSIPCSLGTLLKDTVFATAPPGATVHLITQSFAGGIPGVSDFKALADQVTSSVHDAIITAGTSTEPVTPLEIKVYRGPDIQVPSFFGFIPLSSGSFNVVATATGSPIAGLVIVAVIVAALIILAFFVFLIVSTVKDIIATGGGGVLTAGAIAITAVALVGGGLALYLLTRPSVRRALK